jgi:hypothetical protein
MATKTAGLADANHQHAVPGRHLTVLATQVASQLETTWDSIRPGQRAWLGATVGALLPFLLFMAFMGTLVKGGLETLLALTIFLLAGVVLALLFGLLAILIRAVLNLMPPLFFGAAVGSIGGFIFILTQFPFPDEVVRVLAVIPVLIEAILGAAIAVIFGGMKTLSPLRKTITVAGFISSISLSAVTIYWLSSPGFLPVPTPTADATNVPQLDAPDPAKPGNFQVRTLFYGSGMDRQRPEYGVLVSLKTQPVDGSSFVQSWRGLSGKIRQHYWGFDDKAMPLNGRVWYPAGDGPFPLVVIVHGSHAMEEFSDSGYTYLGELLASRGMIVVSVDQNFLNTTLQTLGLGSIEDENDLRAWLLLQHLRLWHEWNAAKDNLFYAKVDTTNIALVGHSRGGQAVAIVALFNKLSSYPEDAAVKFDFHFNIRSIVAIAPAQEQYKPAGRLVTLENVNYLVLQGSYDSDGIAYYGIGQYNRIKFTDDQYWLKASVYIDRANHGQFNTVWGRTDQPPPLSWFLNTVPLIDGEAQRKIAKVYISAFLEATLGHKREYVPLFQDHRRGAAWLPAVTILNQVEDSRFRVLADFDEDFDVTTGTAAGIILTGQNLAVWHEGLLVLRQGSQDTSGAYLGWNKIDTSDKPASYTIVLPDGLAQQWQLDNRSRLFFSLADGNRIPSAPGSTDSQSRPSATVPLDLTVELVASNGLTVRLPLSRFAVIPSPIEVHLTKWDMLNTGRWTSLWEPVLQTFELPLADFVQVNPDFNPSSLKLIRFSLDRVPVGTIILDAVGFQLSR